MADNDPGFRLRQIRNIQFQRLEVDSTSENAGGQKPFGCKLIMMRVLSTLHLAIMLATIGIFIYFVILDEQRRVKPFKLICVGPHASSSEICIIAIGQFAYGFIAIGQVAVGFITISQVGVGLLFTLSQLGVSLLCALGQGVTAPYIPICQHGIAGIKMHKAVVGVQLYPYFFQNEEAVVRCKCRKGGASK